MAEKKVYVAVIGYGHLGKWHAQKAEQLEQSVLAAIVEPSPNNAAAAKEKFPHVKVVSSLSEVIEEIDAGIIVSPTSTHAEMAGELLKAGKHVFCEKPLVSTLKEVEELEKLRTSQEGAIFQVGHSERCHEIWEKLDPYRGLLNDPLMMKFHRLAPFKGRATDVDVVQDLMIHDLDLLLWLTKDWPVSLRAEGMKGRTEHWDFVQCEVLFEDGWRAYLTVGRNWVKEVRNVEVFHRDGVFEVDLLQNTFRYANPNEQDPEKYVEEMNYQKRDHLLKEQESFYNAIVSGHPPMVSFEEGKDIVKLIESVLTSLEKGSWVEL